MNIVLHLDIFYCICIILIWLNILLWPHETIILFQNLHVRISFISGCILEHRA